jgi:hypothetical protein
MCLPRLSIVHPEKIFERTVIGALELRIEKARGQFALFPVIMKTFAAFILPLTGTVGTIAIFLVAP